MKKSKVLMVVVLLMFTSIVFGQDTVPVQEVSKIDFSKIWELIVKISPYVAGMFIALFGASEGLAESPNVKANSVKQFFWNLAIKLAKKQADKIKK